jgi:hypothetical protein
MAEFEIPRVTVEAAARVSTGRHERHEERLSPAQMAGLLLALALMALGMALMIGWVSL